MKTKVLLLGFLVFLVFTVQAQRSVRIGYIDMEYILENVDEYQEANTQLNDKAQKWKIEIDQMRNKVEQMKKELNAEKVLLTKELIQEREEDIQILEREMLEYQQDRFGPEGDLVIQKRLLVQPVQDQVFNAVQEIAGNRRYDFIFDKSADVVMLYSDKKYDISDQVLRRINVTRKQDERKGRSKQNKTQNNRNQNIDTPPPPNPEIEARKKNVEEKRAQRAAELEARRQERLKEREALKKAYEERKKKILEEREARKKAAKEAKDKKKKEKENNNN